MLTLGWGSILSLVAFCLYQTLKRPPKRDEKEPRPASSGSAGRVAVAEKEDA